MTDGIEEGSALGRHVGTPDGTTLGTLLGKDEGCVEDEMGDVTRT